MDPQHLRAYLVPLTALRQRRQLHPLTRPLPAQARRPAPQLPGHERHLVDRLAGDAVLVLQHQQHHEGTADELQVAVTLAKITLDSWVELMVFQNGDFAGGFAGTKVGKPSLFGWDFNAPSASACRAPRSTPSPSPWWR